LLSFSAVKVRKFGDHFAVDSRIDYHDRWDDKRIQKKICDLYSKENEERRLFALIGFDDADEPFRKEFANLAREIDWESHGVFHQKKTWRDPWGRQFMCVVAIWEK
jgi:hypothetical protein